MQEAEGRIILLLLVTVTVTGTMDSEWDMLTCGDHMYLLVNLITVVHLVVQHKTLSFSLIFMREFVTCTFCQIKSPLNFLVKKSILLCNKNHTDVQIIMAQTKLKPRPHDSHDTAFRQ